MNRMRQGRRGPRLLVCAIAAALLAACGGGGSGGGSSGGGGGGGGGGTPGTLTLTTLSNRADLVSDGDALVLLSSSTGSFPADLGIDVDGRPVTLVFAPVNGRLIGPVKGLINGANVITARGTGMTGARLTITNRPRSGPVFSGAQITPFYCATVSPQPVNGNIPASNASGLSTAMDATCTPTFTEDKFYYRTTTAGCVFGLPDPQWTITPTATVVPPAPTASASNCFKPYPLSGPRPADMATTTTDNGRTVDYIVHVERGTMNRGIYDIVEVYDPNSAWTPTLRQPQWNGKVYFAFGSSTGQPRRQARPTIFWTTLDEQLKRGYVVALNSMMDSSRNSNRVLMAETVMMMKEHIIDTLGEVSFTIGAGCSGGSINSNMTASIMPGLLDGLITTCTYPDSETTAMEVFDCVMLVEAYQKPAMLSVWSGLNLTQPQINTRKAAINGHVDQTACHAWYNSFGSNGRAGLFLQRAVLTAANDTGVISQAVTPTNNCELPNSAVYDPANLATTSNLPRCNQWSWAESIWGKVTGSVQARDPRDNVGVQYGLKALNDGVITAEEFVTLNELAGGADKDSTPTAARAVADPEALQIAYRSGIVMSGKNLARVPIIDMRAWDDSLLAANTPPGVTGPGGIHHIWYSFALRDRLIADSDSHNAGNQAMWRFTRPGLTPSTTIQVEALNAMDAWLTTLKADTSAATLEAKVRTARPAAAQDLCYLSGDVAQTTKVTDFAVCDADPFLKPTLSPRQVAGGPRAENILKCQLKPLAVGDYPTLSGAQFARLQAVFPGGVCDWSKAGVGQQAAVSPLTFAAGPGGADLPAAPVSTAAP